MTTTPDRPEYIEEGSKADQILKRYSQPAEATGSTPPSLNYVGEVGRGVLVTFRRQSTISRPSNSPYDDE